ncbi:MAG TPA: hypothetical protein VFA41_08730 [Ktedonobacteraceae bacterium]|jgi:chaperonin cofactor prefoldin|nr:hypothetical protein [Ktedonobacteraceae bacterium]
MPTQEERLTALERFQKQVADHIRETEENTTILLGVIRSQGRDIRNMVQRLEAIDGRLETIDGRLDTFEQRFNGLEQRFDGLDQKLAQVLRLLARPDQEP